jgi:colanic acid/amylovoran biosynthesis glycosyltransferase
MTTVAYLANQFPVPVEPYVADEIRELRRRDVRVISGSVRTPSATSNTTPDICIGSIRVLPLIRATILIATGWRKISPIIRSVLLRRKETPSVRTKALLHTLLGAYYAALLRGRGVDHIHVHHGYFASWIAMIAARLLNIDFSVTLHGSDLLLHPTLLDEKLRNCRFCITISEYNRRYVLKHFPEISRGKVFLCRLGVDVPSRVASANLPNLAKRKLTLFTAGRLHPVKNQAFLVRACARLRERGLDVECLIAGEGPERCVLEALIRSYCLQNSVKLLGHVAPQLMQSLYQSADLFVLTSFSEGIPLVLMEAMANELIVLAPAITGIPELISAGKTGYVYKAADMGDFLQQIVAIHKIIRDSSALTRCAMRRAARTKILHDFNRSRNLTYFADLFLQSISSPPRSSPHEDSVLQQVQLSL